MEFVGAMLHQAIDRILYGEVDLWSTAWRTLRLALESTFLALSIGLPIGVWLGEAATRIRRLGVVVANAGLGLPPVVLGVFLALALYPRSPLGRFELMDTLNAAIIAQTLLALPIVVALTAAAVAGLPSGLLDQARAFGASGTRRRVLALREARVGVIAAVIGALLSALAEVGAVVIVGGNVRGQTNTLASTVLLDLSAGDPAAATANVLILLTLVLMVGGMLTIVQQRAAR
jgi:tungstate transport system permease protein